MERTSVRSTFVVMVSTALSRLLGYVKVALVAWIYGATGQADAIWATFNIPNDLRKLFAEGAISSAFIPTLSTALVEDPGGGRARALARNLMTLQLVILAPLVALSIALPRPFVGLLLSFNDPAQVELSAGLFRWMFSYILLVSLSATVMAVLNTHQRFVVSALSPLLFSVAVIGSVLLFRRSLGAYAMALGVVVGGLAQLVFQLPSYRRRGYDLRPSFRFRDPDFRRTLGLWLPFLVSASVFALMQMVARLFASGLETGSVSAISYSVTVLQLPMGVFSASVMTVLFPAMSRQAASSDTEGLRASVASGMQSLTVLLIPSAVFLVGYGREIISGALQRGEFTAEATEMAARVLAAYSVGLLSLGLHGFVQRYFYAVKDFRRPIVSAAIIAVVDISLSLVLKETRLRVAGLAVANTVAFTAGFGYLLVVARRRLGRLGARAWLTTALKTSLACLPMVGILAAYHRWLPELWRGGGRLVSVGVALAVTAACVGVTLASLLALRVSYVRELLAKRRRGPA